MAKKVKEKLMGKNQPSPPRTFFLLQQKMFHLEYYPADIKIHLYTIIYPSNMRKMKVNLKDSHQLKTSPYN